MKSSDLLVATFACGALLAPVVGCSSSGNGGNPGGGGFGSGGSGSSAQGGRSGSGGSTGTGGQSTSTGGSGAATGGTSGGSGGVSGSGGSAGSPGSGGAPAGSGGTTGDAAPGGDAPKDGTPPTTGDGGAPPDPATPGATDLTKHKFSKIITMNTTATGANVPGDVAKYPVAVQLNAMNFDFAQAMPGGEDIRFATAAGVVLPYSIELWDAAGKAAAIWVKVDVKGNTNAQNIVMHWGNPAAQSASSAKTVFSMEDGYRGVWHLDQEGSEAPGHYKDSSPHEAHLTGFRLAPGSRVAGRIGSGTWTDNLRGQGKNQWLGIEGPKVVTEYNAGPTKAITASVWAYAHAFDGYYQTIFSKGDHAWSLQREGNGGNIETCNWSGSYHSCAIIQGAAVAKQWRHYLITSTPSQLTLFIDGKRAGAAGASNQISDHGFALGHNYEAHADALVKAREWNGIFDEARVIVGPAKDANWALLEFQSQKEGSTFLSYGPVVTK